MEVQSQESSSTCALPAWHSCTVYLRVSSKSTDFSLRKFTTIHGNPYHLPLIKGNHKLGVVVLTCNPCTQDLKVWGYTMRQWVPISKKKWTEWVKQHKIVSDSMPHIVISLYVAHHVTPQWGGGSLCYHLGGSSPPGNPPQSLKRKPCQQTKYHCPSGHTLFLII
jgi:hypothetical protein